MSSLKEDFKAWVKARGGYVHPKLDLFKTLPNGDRGVIATEDLAENTVLVLLPVSCTLYIPSAKELASCPEAFPQAVRYLKETHPGISARLATTLALMSAAGAGGGSAYAAYLATLPARCPDSLLHWSAEERKELQGTSLEECGAEAADVYARHVAPLVAARPDLWPAACSSCDEFVRLCGLMQSRAFHMEASNWLTGSSEVVRVDEAAADEDPDAATQVYLLPGIDMINHSNHPERRNAHLQKISLAQAGQLTLEGVDAEFGGVDGCDAFFLMRADKPIPAGCEVLHTYGNLSDAQLLQTYGFIDSDEGALMAGRGQAAGQAAPAAGQAPAGGSDKKRGRQAKGGETAGAQEVAAAADGSGGGGGYINPHNSVLVPWGTVRDVCRSLLKSIDQAPSKALLQAKSQFLAECGLLQPGSTLDKTCFVLTAGEALPDDLLNVVQVLLMTKEEFEAMKQEHTAGLAAAAAAGEEAGPSAGAAPAAAGGSQQKLRKLSLGRTLLEEDEDFAEMTSIAMLQCIEACNDRYPTPVREDVRLLKATGPAACSGRKRLAVLVRLGEKDVLQIAKKGVVEMLKQLREAHAARAGGSDDEGEEEDDEEEEEQKADEGQQGGGKRQRRGLGAGKEGEAGNAAGDADDITDGDGTPGDGDETPGVLNSEDSEDKVGYGAVDYDDGPGEAHDRGKPHDPPPPGE